jgi:lipopolysaccharide transport system permease protein
VTSSAAPPSALGGGEDLFRYRALVRNLVFKDLKLKYRDSLLGVAWSLLNPLLTLAVYTFAFRTVLHVQMEHYAFFLLVSLLPWNFFAGSLVASTGAILQNAALIRKVNFPREVLPISTVLFGFSQLLLAFSVFVPCLLLTSTLPLRWTFVLAVPLLLLHVVFTVGLAFVLSALTALFRDIAHLTEVALLLLFWLTPIVYPVSMVPPGLQSILKLSPFAAFTIAYQDVLFFGRVPELRVLGSLCVCTTVSLVVGLVVFRRLSPGFAERV